MHDRRRLKALAGAAALPGELAYDASQPSVDDRDAGRATAPQAALIVLHGHPRDATRRFGAGLGEVTRELLRRTDVEVNP